MSLNRSVASIVGALYLALGLVGVGATRSTGFAASHGPTVCGFEVNPLHAILAVVAGLMLLYAAAMASAAPVNVFVGAVLLVVGLVGLVALARPGGWGSSNVLALNDADNLLHLGTAAVLLYVGLRRR